jgi:hypothetical protein
MEDIVSAKLTPNRSNTPATNRDADFFEPQPTPTHQLPDARSTVERLALVACEILAGTRAIEQIGRWVSEDVYRMLAERAIAARRARARRMETQSVRPHIVVASTRVSEPRDGIIEGVSIVTIGHRTRAVCIRLEGLDHRWRASALALI